VQQDLDQSPKEPKACVGAESEEGKHQFHLTHFINENHVLYFSALYALLLLCAFKFQELL
jgi:hypothetical protein